MAFPSGCKSCNRLCVTLLVSVLFAPGCVKVGPEFSHPPAKVSSSWQDAGDQRVKTEWAEYKNWWQAFNDPVLDRLIERAYRENLSLRIAGVRVLEARARLGVIVGGLYPQTQQASGSLQYNRISERAPTSALFSKFDYSQDQVGVNASWELDFWGKFRRAIESADARFTGDGRRLRQRPGEPYGRCGEFLHPDPDPGEAARALPARTWRPRKKA